MLDDVYLAWLLVKEVFCSNLGKVFHEAFFFLSVYIIMDIFQVIREMVYCNFKSVV